MVLAPSIDVHVVTKCGPCWLIACLSGVPWTGYPIAAERTHTSYMPVGGVCFTYIDLILLRDEVDSPVWA